MYEELKQYYAAQGISAMDFQCKNESLCRGNNSPHFRTAREAFVGIEYERHTLPRLLFISLDPGILPIETEHKTMDAQREGEIHCDPLSLSKTSHWYHTHEVAHTLLRRFDENLEFGEVCQYFAHTNSAKCCQNKIEKSQADGRLFYYCREYLEGEIAILDPDIIVTQGNQACWSIQTVYDGSITLKEIEESPSCNYGTIEINGREIVWFHCYHPRYGKYWTQRKDCHVFWSEVAYEHLEQYGWRQ